MRRALPSSSLLALLVCVSTLAPAQGPSAASAEPAAPASKPAAAVASTAPAPAAEAVELETIVVTSSADASAEGLSRPFAGGQVARGGRAGILGTHDQLETPFSITSYTNELIQDRQARSVGDVLQNDPTVRVARGFGNFQESYFIRGFILNSDDVAYNGLYSLLPRQYIATELFERVEVLRGASAFLNGANPGGGGLGGAINLLPKRAPNEPLTRLTVGGGSGIFGTTALDVARRFGADQSFGVRVNAALRSGGTSVDDENAKLGLFAVGADWRGERLRLSADLGWQDNQLDETRPNVMLTGVNKVPDAPDADSNWAQPWSFSNERDLFGTLRGEFDLLPDLTVWAAYGLRRSEEANALGNLTVTDADSGAGNITRFDNTREDRVDTGELGLRGKFATGAVGHEWVIAASAFELEKRNAFIVESGTNALVTGLYDPISYTRPDFSAMAFAGNDLKDPAVTGRTTLASVAVGDTLSMLDERLRLTLGGRWQTLKIDNLGYDTLPGTPDYDEDRISPVAGVVYRLQPSLSLYGNYVEGLSQGDTAPSDSNSPGKMLKPYVSKQGEIGTKYESKRLGLGVALFTTKKPRSILEDGDFSSQGRDRHRGLELTTYGVAADGLRLLGGMTLLDAKQRKTGNDATEGERVIGVPKFQASLGAELDVSALRGLALDGRIIHTGSSYAGGDGTLRVDDWTRLDAGARYLFDWQSTPVTLRARVDNLLGEDYWASVGGFPESGYLVAGGARSLVLSASVDF